MEMLLGCGEDWVPGAQGRIRVIRHWALVKRQIGKGTASEDFMPF